MTSRTQYLIFLSIWVAIILLTAAIAGLSGVTLKRGPLYVVALIALIPAAIGYVLVRTVGSLVDRWKVLHGHDVYRERQFEDDAGFIHLNEVPAIEQQREVGLAEIVLDLEPPLEGNPKKDDSE
ncbi:MAG TPA: hypothetical protein VGJ55_07655 [Pyrinomonadaceae bacterium]|jgi:hypothetical protein